MVAIPGGTFLMGTEDEEIEKLVKKFNWEGFGGERPQHEVTDDGVANSTQLVNVVAGKALKT